jgi:hypothetical protein
MGSSSPDWVAQFNSIILTAETGQRAFFNSYANTVFLSLAACLLVFWGIKTALAGFDMYDFLKILFLIVTVKAIILAYGTPQTWLADRTFPDFIIDGPKMMASNISDASLQQVCDTVDQIIAQHPSPMNPLNFWLIIEAVWLELELELAKAVMWAVCIFGLVAQAVCVLVGPIFIPFLLIKPLAFLFWGWFRSLLMYSFYPLVAACYVYILANFLTTILVKFFGPDGSRGTAAQAVVLSPFIIIVILSMLTVPSVTSAIFHGHATSTGGVARNLAYTAMSFKGIR